MPGTDLPIAQECVEGYLFVAAPLSILLLQRPADRDGIWVPVSGKVERSDPEHRRALLREIREETGFSHVDRVFPLGWEVPFPGPNGERWRLHAFGVELPARLAPTLSDEHVAYAWLPPGRARARLHYEDNQQAVDRLLERLGSSPLPAKR